MSVTQGEVKPRSNGPNRPAATGTAEGFGIAPPATKSVAEGIYALPVLVRIEQCKQQWLWRPVATAMATSVVAGARWCTGAGLWLALEGTR